MTLSAYIDESGTHGGSPLTVMAGWVSTNERWHEFDLRWGGLLALPGGGRGAAGYVHSTELRQGKGQFKGWPIGERQSFAARAAAIAHECSVFGQTVILKTKDYERHYVGEDKQTRAAMDSKYGVAFRIFISTMARRLEADFPGEKVTLILEDGHMNSGAAPRIWTEMQQVNPTLADRIARVTFAKKKDTWPLQAADMLVYPAFVLERDGLVLFAPEDPNPHVSGSDPDYVANYRIELDPKALTDMRQAQLHLVGIRRANKRRTKDAASAPTSAKTS